ncbi:MAG: DNA replication protein [Candidatus Phytoplasma cynodontis]|uniref:DnaD domain protein n=1 Tax='Cynodon dactylon' phytoplasma TaxID=295320 RepID=UPI001265C864|nr:DnaD domain protein ['Cynodon dactylon' phytoplasma]KAB8121706.1 DnaD domain protein ['Cynodon dactylon' phytoplasma]WIA07678.1 MAG: DNA replication protein [Candidatus Phytoplasma cynodontis]
MLKMLYEEGYLNIEKILIKEYKNLNLEIKELTILLLILNDEKKECFSSLNLVEKTNWSKNEIELILEKLMKKNFFDIVQQKQKDKIIEILNLENTFSQLENFFMKKKNIKKEIKKNYIKETIEILENLKGKNLTGFELEIIKNWYSDKKYSHKEIINSIKESFSCNKTSLNYIETILNKKQKKIFNKNFQDDQILHKIFKKIK